MRRDNVWILVGMAAQAVITGTLDALGRLTVSALQQTRAAGFFVIVAFLSLIITRELNRFLVGIALGTLIAGTVAYFGVIDLSPENQFIAATLLLLIAVAILAFRKSS